MTLEDARWFGRFAAVAARAAVWARLGEAELAAKELERALRSYIESPEADPALVQILRPYLEDE